MPPYWGPPAGVGVGRATTWVAVGAGVLVGLVVAPGMAVGAGALVAAGAGASVAAGAGASVAPAAGASVAAGAGALVAVGSSAEPQATPTTSTAMTASGSSSRMLKSLCISIIFPSPPRGPGLHYRRSLFSVADRLASISNWRDTRLQLSHQTAGY